MAYTQSPALLNEHYYLIAHRGGVVDSTNTSNSRPAIEAAIRRGYDMVEVDLRLTKDSVFIIQHDLTFKRYYGVDKPVSSMTWYQISKLHSSRGGNHVLRLQDALKICMGRVQLMIDNKIKGKHPALFTRLISLLKEYDLLNQALMIGTGESTPFFTGKIKLSCTRKQLEKNMRKPGYSPDDYYLFEVPENISARDVKWAKKNSIEVVAIINKFRYGHSKEPFQKAQEDINRMKSEGVTHFQIDSEFDTYFSH